MVILPSLESALPFMSQKASSKVSRNSRRISSSVFLPDLTSGCYLALYVCLISLISNWPEPSESIILYAFLQSATLIEFISPLMDLRNSSYEISPLPSLSKTSKAWDTYFGERSILKSCMALANSCLSRDLLPLSSAILNFLPIPEIPLAPLEAIFFLIYSKSWASLAFKSRAASTYFDGSGVLKMLLVYLALGIEAFDAVD